MRPAEHLHAHQRRLGAKQVRVDLLQRVAPHVPVAVAVHARKHVRAHLVLPERRQHALQHPLRPRVYGLERRPEPLLRRGQRAAGLPIWRRRLLGRHGSRGGGRRGGGSGGRGGVKARCWGRGGREEEAPRDVGPDQEQERGWQQPPSAAATPRVSGGVGHVPC